MASSCTTALMPALLPVSEGSADGRGVQCHQHQPALSEYQQRLYRLPRHCCISAACPYSFLTQTGPRQQKMVKQKFPYHPGLNGTVAGRCCVCCFFGAHHRTAQCGTEQSSSAYDLTQEKRYSRQHAYQGTAGGTKDIVFVTIYLARRSHPEHAATSQTSTVEMLKQFKAYGHDNIQWEIQNPFDITDEVNLGKFIQELEDRGVYSISFQFLPIKNRPADFLSFHMPTSTTKARI